MAQEKNVRESAQTVTINLDGCMHCKLHEFLAAWAIANPDEGMTTQNIDDAIRGVSGCLGDMIASAVKPQRHSEKLGIMVSEVAHRIHLHIEQSADPHQTLRTVKPHGSA